MVCTGPGSNCGTEMGTWRVGTGLRWLGSGGGRVLWEGLDPLCAVAAQSLAIVTATAEDALEVFADVHEHGQRERVCQHGPLLLCARRV